MHRVSARNEFEENQNKYFQKKIKLKGDIFPGVI
jgi:hypothetical protein